MASLSRVDFRTCAIAFGLAALVASLPVQAEDAPGADAPASESTEAAGDASGDASKEDSEFDFDDFDELDALDVEDESAAAQKAEELEETDTDDPEEREQGIETMTVTANKREENVQDVPISVTALNADFIEETGLTDFNSIQKFVANLAIFDGTDTRSTSIRIRGIGSVGTNAGIDPSVGLFIDGVYQGRAGMSMGDLIDITAIEVLRGPQGTLYGKNTAAGLISIRTADPTYSYSAMAEGTFGNYDQALLRASFNVPVLDERIATRAAMYWSMRDGWDTNLYTGSNINDLGKWGIRNKWLFDPVENFQIVLAGDYAHQTSECCVPDILTYEGDSLLWRGNNPPNPPATFPDRNTNPNFDKMAGYVNPAPGGTYDFFNGAQVDVPKPELRNFVPFDGIVDVNLDPKNDVTIWGVQADLDYMIEEWNLNWLTAYRQYKSDSQFDGDFSQYNAVESDTSEDLEQVSTELRVTSPLWEYFDFTAGFYFFYMNHYTDGNLGFEQDFADIFVATQPDPTTPFGFYPINNNDVNRYKTYSYALYSQGNFKFADHWRLTGGIRLSLEKKTLKGSQISDSGLNAPPISGPDIYRDDERTVEDVSGTVKLSYSRDDWMVYGSFATGFKSGGFNQLRTAQDVSPEFGDESAFAYEAGVRTTWIDQKLLVNATGYFTDYQDFQAQSFSGTSITIRNAGDFYSYGFEAEVIAMPFDDFTWTTGVGLNIAEYQEFDDAENTIVNIVDKAAGYGLAPFPFSLRTGLEPDDPQYIDDTVGQDLAGRVLDNAPRWSVNSSIHYEHPIGSTGLKWILHTDYSFRSAIYLNQDLDPNLKDPPLNLLGFRAGFGEENNAWQLIGWVTNVLNEQYMVSGFDVPVLGGFAAIRGAPRQYGATLRWKY